MTKMRFSFCRSPFLMYVQEWVRHRFGSGAFPIYLGATAARQLEFQQTIDSWWKEKRPALIIPALKESDLTLVIPSLWEKTKHHLEALFERSQDREGFLDEKECLREVYDRMRRTSFYLDPVIERDGRWFTPRQTQLMLHLAEGLAAGHWEAADC